MRPFIEAIRPLIPFVSLFVITTVWILYSTNDIISKEPRTLFFLFGIVFSNISVSYTRKMNTKKSNDLFICCCQCRLIVAQMSDTRADCWNHLMWLILIVSGLSVAPKDSFYLSILDQNIETVLLYFLSSVALLTHLHYGYGVVCLINNVYNLNEQRSQLGIFFTTSEPKKSKYK